MIQRSAARSGDGREVPTWFVLGLVGMAATLAYVALWNGIAITGSLFGGDLIAYTSAADRLAATGSPYHPALFLGPIVSGDNVPIGYFYPPVLAQMFLPFRDIPHFELAVGWSSAQAICLAILLPLVLARRTTGTLKVALLAIAFGLGFYPLQLAIFSGNVSGWLAIGVAISLVHGPRIGGIVAAVATAVKLLPFPMFVAALTGRRSRRSTVITMAAVVTTSVLLAPQAWMDFVTILPNILRIGTASGFTNLSPAHTFDEVGLPGLGLLVGWVLAFGFGAAAVVTGWREGYSNRVVAMSVFSVTFASSTLWDHYLGVMAPLILWAWPAGGTRQRGAIAAFAVIAAGLWTQIGMNPEYRAALMISLIVCTLAIATIREPVADRGVAWVRLPAGLT